MQKQFGLSMRAHRKNLGLSQEKLAQLLNHNRTYIGSVERGERNLTLCTVEQFCDALDLDPLEMLAGPAATPLSTDARDADYSHL